MHHLRIDHNMTSEEYAVHLVGGDRPTCYNCAGEVRRLGYQFKKYCKKCSKVAEREGGKKGGKARAWNKGLTKETDARLQTYADKVSGSGNSFFGKSHAPDSIEKMRKSKRVSREEFYQRLESRSDVSLVSLYTEFETRQQKNLKFKCLNCDHQFVTSMVYAERGFQCPECGKRQNPFEGKTHTEETIEALAKKQRLSRLEFSKRISERENDFILLTPYEEYRSRQKQYLSVMCSLCGEICQRTLQSLERGSQCYKCFPPTSSKGEREVADFVEGLGFDVVRNDRVVLSGKEIDVWIPEKQVGIEFNGLYWHSEMSGIDSKQHLQKTEQAVVTGANLIHIYSDEWYNKREICESMLCHRLGRSLRTIYARDCSVSEVDSYTARDFFDDCHIDGNSPARYRLGLFCQDELVACISARTPRNKKKYQNTIEICRFATAKNTSVVGGLSRLMKHTKIWATKQGYKKILSYAERRFGTGKGYRKAGFNLIGHTGLSYWYTDGIVREHRFKYRAKDGQTEKDVARNAGVSRIWGCGSNIWIMDIS
tara:strand:- start:223 stop:1842 length:1620 start_codon:yes stop_codon:yes gene_type:complete